MNYYNFKKAIKEIETIKKDVKYYMKKANAVIEEITDEFILFHVVCKEKELAEMEIRNLSEKTRFEEIENNDIDGVMFLRSYKLNIYRG